MRAFLVYVEDQERALISQINAILLKYVGSWGRATKILLKWK